MKIAKSAYSKDDSKGNRKVKPILPLVPEDDSLEYEDSTKVSTFKLRTVPADADSAKYSFPSRSWTEHALYVKPSTGTTGPRNSFVVSISRTVRLRTT